MRFAILFLFIHAAALGQSISSSLPKEVVPSERYLFYLHGGVVTGLGDNAINPSAPEWGPYEYLNILDSLQSRGFHVISENRKEGVEDSVYVNKIVKQVDSLLTQEVPAENLLMVGASAGWSIAVYVSSKLKNEDISFVLMGGCWPETYKEYLGIELYGHFLSIIEASDPHQTCGKLFENRTQLSSYQEVTLHTGLSHGFIYKGYQEWIDPVVFWFEQK